MASALSTSFTERFDVAKGADVDCFDEYVWLQDMHIYSSDLIQRAGQTLVAANESSLDSTGGIPKAAALKTPR